MTAISAGVCPCKLICLIAVLQHSPLFNRRRFAPVVVLRFPTETATVQGALFPTVWGELLTHAASGTRFNFQFPSSTSRYSIGYCEHTYSRNFVGSGAVLAAASHVSSMPDCSWFIATTSKGSVRAPSYDCVKNSRLTQGEAWYRGTRDTMTYTDFRKACENHHHAWYSKNFSDITSQPIGYSGRDGMPNVDLLR